MRTRARLLMVVATGALVLPLATPSLAESGTGNNNGNGNVGSGNGNCNSGNNNGNNNVGNFKGNGSPPKSEAQELQMKRLREQFGDTPWGEALLKILADC
jgi:hypothetical protein